MMVRFAPLTLCETPGCESLTDQQLCESCRRGVPPKKQRRNPVSGRSVRERPEKTYSPEDRRRGKGD
jgi:hypothetical protein